MATTQFKLSIGAKRQVTIPANCMKMLSLEEGGELLLQIVGDHAVLLPVVSVPRHELPIDLRRKFESRRGAKASDIPLGEFLGELGYKPAEKSAGKHKPVRRLAAAAQKARRSAVLTPAITAEAH